MPGDLTYFRKFIILKNDHTNIPNIVPKGHGKIEVRGNRVNIRINLENCELEEEYRIYLLKEEEGLVEELDLGRIFTDERGRGRSDINISLRDLESKGFVVEKLDAILVRKDEGILLSAHISHEKEAINEYISSLARKGEKVEEDVKVEEPQGPQGEKDLSKFFPVSSDYGNFYKDVEEGKVVEKAEEVKDLKEEPEKEIKEEKDESVEAAKRAEEDELLQEETYEVKKDNAVEEVEGKKYEFIGEEVAKVEQEVPKSSYVYDHYKSLEYMRQINNKNQMTNYILSVLKYFPQVQPFKIYLHGYTWWRIDDDGSNANRGFLPYYNYLFSASYKYPFLYNSTTCMDQILKYGHYLFGLYKEGEEVKYYVYAVPGTFTIDEHPFRGITGFNTWYESIDGVGYWLLYIDPLTGETIYPINPMVPTE